MREAAEKRGIMSPADLAKAMGHKSRTIAGRLWKGEDVRLVSLDQAAEALGCDLSELIRREPDLKARKTRPAKAGGKRRGVKRRRSG